MRGLISNAPVDCAMDGGILHSAISVGVICPDKHERRFAQFISELNYRSQAKHNTDYLITFPGFYQAFKTGLDLPEPNSGKWKQINASNEQDIHKAIDGIGVLPVLGGQNLDPKKGTVRNAVAINNQ